MRSNRHHYHHPRARELNTILLSRGIRLWQSACGALDEINAALVFESIRMSRLVGGQV